MRAHSSERSSLPGSGSVVALRQRSARARWNEGPLGRSEILALQRTAGNRAVSEMLTLQRAWAPAVTTAKTTLRTGPSTGQPKVGGSLPVGTRVVADRAQRQVEAITGFYIHFVVFVLVMILLFVINLKVLDEVWWVQWPLLGWGIGIVAHAFAVFGQQPRFVTNWQLRKIKQLRDKM